MTMVLAPDKRAKQSAAAKQRNEDGTSLDGAAPAREEQQ